MILRTRLEMKRRELLRATGLGGVAALLPSVRQAQAANSIPTRFIVFYTPHGTLPDAWKPKGPGGAAATETQFDLGELHQPLVDHKKDLILLSGLDMRSWSSSKLQSCGHTNGQVHSLTNAHQISATSAAGPSIDQYIAQGWKAKNGGVSPTKVPSMVLGVAGDTYYTSSAFSSGPNAGVPMESSPLRAYQRLFPNGIELPDSSAAMATIKRRTGAMNYAAGEFAAVGNLLGKDERVKLDAHASAIKDLESRLGQLPLNSCMPPTAPPSKAGWHDGSDAMIRLIQTGFSCDLTRVASMWIGNTPDGESGYGGGMFGTTDIHDLVHQVDGALAKNPAAVAVIKTFHIAYSKILAKLIAALKAIPESDGKTLFDHTVILWAGELAQGGHGCTNLKWMLAGSANGYFRTNRYLSWGDFNRGEYAEDKTVPSNGDLFCSLASAVGIPTQTFGDASASKGPIGTLRA